jgi:lipoprotein-releasing system permease protein
MPYEIFLALRYLRSRQKRRLARVTALMAVVGIAMGVAALIIALALANGFRDEMREKILQGTAHLTVLRRDGNPLDKHVEIAQRVRQLNGVVSVSTTTYDGALVSGSKETAYAVLRGIEPDLSAQVQPWIINGALGPLFDSSNITESSVPQAVVGAELAAKIGVSVGDSVDLLSLYGGLSNRPSRRLRVAGTFRSGLFEYDTTWIYVSFETTTELAGSDHAGSVISVQVNDADNVKHIAANVLNTLGSDYTTIDWQQANQPLFTALALERRMGVVIVGLIIAIAVLNITTMLILVVVERRRDIAILSTLGATRTGVMAVFMIEGAVVGAIGAAAGVLLGLAACFIGNRYKLVSLPADVYSISNVPFNVTMNEVALAALIAFGLSVLATIYPARNAARMRPVEVLRDAW